MNREDIISDFLKFCLYINPNFKINYHILIIAELLNKFVRGGITKLIISLPPRMGKSYLSSILLPAYIMGIDPQEKIIASTYGFDLSKTFSSQLLRILQSPEYQLLFPNTKLINEGRSSTLWETTQQGYYKSTSRGSAITGLSGTTIIVDDIIKNSTEARSPSLLKSIEEWFDSTLYSRLTKKTNGQDPKILVLMTRWSKNDLIGYILKNDEKRKWTYLNIPAINDKGEALWEEQQPLEFLLDIKKRDPETFSCLYMGQPGQKGSTEFVLDNYEIYPVDYKFPRKGSKTIFFSSWDTASKVSQKNDYTVGTLWSITDNKLYLEDYIKGKYTLPELKNLVLNYHKTWNCKFSLIEDASSGIGLIQLYNSDKKLKNQFISIQADVKKKLPIIIPSLEEHFVILKNHSIILNEIEEYPYGEHDDAVSSIVNAIWYWTLFLKKSPHELHKGKISTISNRRGLLNGGSKPYRKRRSIY